MSDDGDSTRPSVTYLGGPMRGIEHYNFPLFELATAALRNWGHEVVSPAEIDEAEGFVHVSRDADNKITGVMLTHKFTIERVLRRDYREITLCDKVVLLPGWENSAGAQGERRLANECGIPVYEITLKEVMGQMYPWLLPVPVEYHTPLRSVPFTNEQAMASVAKDMGHPVFGDLTERREVDPVTGGMKGQKLAQLGAVDPQALMELAEVAGFGTVKYERFNFARGYRWSLSYDAMQRHLHAWQGREDNDPESGRSHLAHAAWHCLTLMTFSSRSRGTDDRFPV